MNTLKSLIMLRDASIARLAEVEPQSTAEMREMMNLGLILKRIENHYVISKQEELMERGEF